MPYRTVDAARLAALGEIRRLPSESARRGLKPGDRAGVLVREGNGDNETVFVTVTSASGNRYQGTPQNPGDLGGQNVLSFGPNNVVDAPGAVSKTMIGGAMIVAGLLGLWWENSSNTKAVEAERQRQLTATTGAGAANAQIGAGTAQGAADAPIVKSSTGLMGSYAGGNFR